MFTSIVIVYLIAVSETWAKDQKLCDEKVNKLKTIEKLQNFCRTSSDCMILNWPKDSYACHRFANKKADLTGYREIISKFSLTCGFPLYECVAPPSSAACIKGICDVETQSAALTKMQAYTLLVEKERLQGPIEKFNARFNDKDKTWTFIENTNQIGLPVYIVTPSGKTRILLGR